MNTAFIHEKRMWDIAMRGDSAAFLDIVSEETIMVCGGYRCTGVEYAKLVGDFGIASYEIDANYTSQSITLDSNFLATHKANMVTNNHNYLIKVYGVDENNSGVEDCFSGVENPYCVASPSISLKWEFNVLTSGLSNMNLSSSSPTKAYIYNTYVGKLEPVDRYKLPSSITVSMGGSDLTLNTDYTYDSSTGAGSS